METKGINILEKKLREYQGKDAVISTFHKLYGEQKLKIQLEFIFVEDRIGFKVNAQEIFVFRDKVVGYGVKDGIHFADDLMEIKIKLY